MVTLQQFLGEVITPPEGVTGYLLLGVGNGVKWWEEWFHWPDQMSAFEARVQEYSVTYNVYFSAHLFDEPTSTKEHVLPTRTIQADLDEADAFSLPLAPSVLVKTSEGRYQAYWILTEHISPQVLETLSRKLTYSIPKCDRSGWTLGHRVRVPESINHKYFSGPQTIEVSELSKRHHTVQTFELLPEAPGILLQHYDEDFVIDPPTAQTDIGPYELLNSIKDKIPPRVHLGYDIRSKDRSAALWALMCAAFRAGLARDEVYLLALHSANNKFAELHYHGTRELAKDVLRAEEVVRSKIIDMRSLMLEARKLPGMAIERKQYIADLVLRHMKDEGIFVRTSEDLTWYIRQDHGRPIVIENRSTYLAILLDVVYTLNSTETEHTFCCSALTSFGKGLPVNGIQGSLSYYDQASRILLLHTGRRDVLRISPEIIERIANGALNIVFPWPISSEPFSPITDPDQLRGHEPWWETICGNSLDNIIGLSSEQAKALVRTWILFILMRNAAMSKPILTFLGQPGSGKTTLFKKVYALLYGRNKSVGSITREEDFDHITSVDPVVVLDNLDSWERWLPDRLALSAGSSDIVRRKLYTDQDTVAVKRQAILGITAHNPRFGREDVADRLLILNFQRLGHFIAETDLIEAVLQKRNLLWGLIIQDLQKVMSTPMPHPDQVPQIRIEDFAKIGAHCAHALGYLNEFTEAIKVIVRSQKTFALEDDGALISAIQLLVNKKVDKFYTAAQLWTIWEAIVDDWPGFSRRYRNSSSLARKLWTIVDALRQIFDVEWQFDSSTTVRSWRFTTRDGTN